METSGKARAVPLGMPMTPVCQSGRGETALKPPLPAKELK